jgi:uncharacterized protein YndB with AHSA1/START domain
MSAAPDLRSFHVLQEIDIEAPAQTVFDSVIAEMSVESEMPDGTPMPLTLEPWPGGRWFRDLGGEKGHLWGHVQVIKPPTLLEICGPMFMSYPVASHLQYRLTPTPTGTRLTLSHRAFGMIPDDHLEGVQEGWAYGLKRVREIALRRAGRTRAN